MEGAVCVFCVCLLSLYEKVFIKYSTQTRVKSKRKRAFVSSFFFKP